MSQYSSRIHIRVSSPEIWRRFEEEDDAGMDLERLADTERKSYVYDYNWWTERELDGTVQSLAKTLGQEGMIIADTTNINVDPYDYCVLYLGERVFCETYSSYYHDMFSETNIANIAEWLNYGKFSLTMRDREYLVRFGIASDGKSFYEFSTDLDIQDKVYLRETSLENHPEIIETCEIGEEVQLVPAGNSYDATRLEVVHKSGSLGCLPSDVSDEITPVLMSKHLAYTAKIVELVKSSQRNKHAKSSIVAIHIEAQFSPKEV